MVLNRELFSLYALMVPSLFHSIYSFLLDSHSSDRTRPTISITDWNSGVCSCDVNIDGAFGRELSPLSTLVLPALFHSIYSFLLESHSHHQTAASVSTTDWNTVL